MGPLRSSNRQQRSPRHPITATSSRWPRALIRRTQKPFSPLWYVTRSTRPASTSWVDGSGCGFMPIVTSAALPLRASLPQTRSDWRVAANQAMFRLMKAQCQVPRRCHVPGFYSPYHGALTASMSNNQRLSRSSASQIGSKIAYTWATATMPGVEQSG
jgi:hypothetical protein